MHCRWYRVKNPLASSVVNCFLSSNFWLDQKWWLNHLGSPKIAKKAACANILWLASNNVIGLGTWLFCQTKLLMRTCKNNQNLKIGKIWVSPLPQEPGRIEYYICLCGHFGCVSETGLGPKYSVLRYFGTRVPILQYSSVLSTRTFKKYLYSYLYSSTFKNKSTFNEYLRVLYEY